MRRGRASIAGAGSSVRPIARPIVWAITGPIVSAIVWAIACGLAFVVAGARPLFAQEVRTEIEPGPYHQGQPVTFHIVATQFEEEPTPEIELERGDGVSLAFLGVSPQTSTSITIVNGQMSRVHEVSFTYRYELTSQRVGRVEVPAARVRQGRTLRRTEPLVLEVAAVPTSDEIGISVVLPAGPIFVGQKVPIALEFRIDQSIVEQVVDYRVHVPLFEEPGLRFIESKPVGANSQLQIVTPKGRVHLAAVQEERVVAGRPSTILRAERILVASKPGMLEVEAPTAAAEMGTRFRQDFFGGRRAVQTRRLLTAGRRLALEVAALPSEGRPPSFAGAVGSDFSFEVTADRSVVALGEPIELRFHVRGRGDLAAAGLPPLDAEGLFDPKRFRLPEDAPAGVVDADGKHFRATVRVLDASVREIPALAYAYFDAETRRFETIHSQPIALSVSAARIVGADAVASAGGEPLAAGAGANGGAETSPEVDGRGAGDGQARASSLAERAANLAIERDPEALLRGASLGRGVPIATVALYGAGLALLAVAFFDRRRRAVDPLLRARVEAFARAKRAIEEASSATHPDGAGALGRALRELVAAHPDEASPALDALLAECDALRFAPGAGGATSVGPRVPESLATRARELVAARLAELARRDARTNETTASNVAARARNGR